MTDTPIDTSIEGVRALVERLSRMADMSTTGNDLLDIGRAAATLDALAKERDAHKLDAEKCAQAAIRASDRARQAERERDEARRTPKGEDDHRYNADEMMRLHHELIGTWERERFDKLPAWARSLIKELIQRIANLRRLYRAREAGKETKGV